MGVTEAGINLTEAAMLFLFLTHRPAVWAPDVVTLMGRLERSLAAARGQADAVAD